MKLISGIFLIEIKGPLLTGLTRDYLEKRELAMITFQFFNSK